MITASSYVMQDFRTGAVLVETKPRRQFQAASLAKILIALDYLERHKPLAGLHDEGRAHLESMLRLSDDDVPNDIGDFWDHVGEGEVITRTADQLQLSDTQPPVLPGHWGYTATSAQDMARIYRHLLQESETGFGQFILTQLRGIAMRAKDGFDQSFGIPSAMPGPWAVKQGWSDRASEKLLQRVKAAGEPPFDVSQRALHTSGLVNFAEKNDRIIDGKVLVAMTLHSPETPWEDAARSLTALTEQVYRQGMDKQRTRTARTGPWPQVAPSLPQPPSQQGRPHSR